MSATQRVLRLVADPPAGLDPLPIDPADFTVVPKAQNWHVAFADETLGLTVGVWDTTAMQEAPGPYPGDEFIVVIDGAFEMRDRHGGAVPVRAGQCATFHDGAPVSWAQDGYLRKFFLLYDDPLAPRGDRPEAAGAVQALDPGATLNESDAVAGSTSGERDRALFANAHGNMTAGVWDTAAFATDMTPFAHHEFCHVLAGETTITEPDGTAHRFGAGDTFFIPAGTVCAWDVPDYLRKYYAILDPSIRPGD